MHDARDAQARRPRGPTRRGAVDLAGVDGCPGGWVLARAGSPRSRFTPRAMEATVHARFSELLRALPADCVVALDMPVGLLDAPAPGGRGCDRAARR
ncbi:MAG: DUF429 domain-containing protein, partial [Gammaproteobacteria bacterium]|nr:DUF429 domain-containing protein [Gammaproteobacteria bacterium]